MKNVLLIGVIVIVFLSGVQIAGSKENKKKPSSAPSSTVKADSVPPSLTSTPPGWTDVKTNAPHLAQVFYKIDGRDIIVRFMNVSTKAPVRIKYTVKWKKGQGGAWADDSTMEGISFRLKPLEQLDREIRTRAPEIKDVVVDVEAAETS